MPSLFETLRVLSIVAFLGYGWSCLFYGGMAVEFERYGLSRFRKLTGFLEVTGALGLLAGYLFPMLTAVAALGLTVLMLLGVITRIRVKDPWFEVVPAFFLMMANGYLFAKALN